MRIFEHQGLRDYQRISAEKAIVSMRRHGRPVIELPTGSGKSHVIAALAAHVASVGKRSLVVIHSKELVQQNAAKILAATDATVGVNCAALGQRDSDAMIVVASVQSIYREPEKLGQFALVIVDECHRVSDDPGSMYQLLLTGLRKTNPDIRLCGLSATPMRTSLGALTSGETFTEVAYRVEPQELIDLGYLAPLTASISRHTPDFSRLHIRSGDFIEGESARLMSDERLLLPACTLIAEQLVSRRACLAFCCSIEHSELTARTLTRLGVRAAAVSSRTDKTERDRLIEDFKAGRLKCLVNCEILTTGFDHPPVDLIAMLRPTLSPILHVQMAGRGMRPSPGKTDCLILDFAGNFARLGPVDDVAIDTPGGRPKKNGTRPTRQCSKCKNRVLAAVCKCPICGAEITSVIEHDWRAKELGEIKPGAALKAQLKYLPVVDWSIDAHVNGGKESLQVTYTLERSVVFHGRPQWIVREWIPVKSTNEKARWVLRTKWRKLGGYEPEPRTLEAAMRRLDELRCPDAIGVQETPGWPKVTAYRHAVEVVNE